MVYVEMHMHGFKAVFQDESSMSHMIMYNHLLSQLSVVFLRDPSEGPLLFLTYINDQPNVYDHSMPFLFADDTHLFSSGKDVKKLYEVANEELNAIAEWFKVNR